MVFSLTRCGNLQIAKVIYLKFVKTHLDKLQYFDPSNTVLLVNELCFARFLDSLNYTQIRRVVNNRRK